MIKFCNLFSGSTGNSTYIESDSTKILVDAGVSCLRITKALASIGVDIDEINAIIISHEHIDHTKGLATIAKKHNTPIYATPKTWASMSAMNINEDCQMTYNAGEDIVIGDVTVHSFSIPHDAADPCGFSILSNGKKITIATDIGHVEEALVDEMRGSDAVLIESNYDCDTLLCGPYPYCLKKRILSDVGHLSNEMTGKLVKQLYEDGVTRFVLGHLSKENNFPELAYQTVLNELNSSELKLPFHLSIAGRDVVDEIMEIV